MVSNSNCYRMKPHNKLWQMRLDYHLCHLCHLHLCHCSTATTRSNSHSHWNLLFEKPIAEIAINTFRHIDIRRHTRKLKWSNMIKNISFDFPWQIVAAQADNTNKIHLLYGKPFLMVNITISHILKNLITTDYKPMYFSSLIKI